MTDLYKLLELLTAMEQDLLNYRNGETYDDDYIQGIRKFLDMKPTTENIKELETFLEKWAPEFFEE